MKLFLLGLLLVTGFAQAQYEIIDQGSFAAKAKMDVYPHIRTPAVYVGIYKEVILYIETPYVLSTEPVNALSDCQIIPAFAPEQQKSVMSTGQIITTQGGRIRVDGTKMSLEIINKAGTNECEKLNYILSGVR